jgi:hypothetical protein
MSGIQAQRIMKVVIPAEADVRQGRDFPCIDN